MICWQDCSVSLQSYSKTNHVIAAMCCRYLYQNQDLSPGTAQTGDPPVSDKRQSRVQWLHLLSVFRIIVIVIALVASIVNHSYHRPSKKNPLCKPVPPSVTRILHKLLCWYLASIVLYLQCCFINIQHVWTQHLSSAHFWRTLGNLLIIQCKRFYSTNWITLWCKISNIVSTPKEMQLKNGRQWSTPEYGLNQEGTIRVTLRIKGRKKYFFNLYYGPGQNNPVILVS